MADLILIPVIGLLLYKIKFNKNGLYEDYLSPERTNILRGVMALDVVLSHFCLDYLNVSQNVLKFCKGDDAVKIFFFLSGYGLVASYKRKGSAYLKGFFSRRLAKIIIPAIPVAILNIIYYIVSDSFYDIGSFTFENCITAFFKNGQTLIYNSWFVIELIVLYAAFYISFKIADDDVQKGVNSSVLMTMLVMIIFYIICLNTEWVHVWYYSTYTFALGMIWAGKKERIDGIFKRHFNAVYMILIPAAVMLIIFKRTILEGFSDGVQTISNNLLLGPLLILFVVIGSMKIKVTCGFWKFMGNISYELFLVHGIIYNGFRGTDIYIQNDLLYIIATLAAAILLAAVLHWLSAQLIKLYFKIIDKFSGKAVKTLQ